jgi:hypothetical protein
MIDGEDSPTIQLHIHLRLVAQRQPEFIHILVLPDKVSAFESRTKRMSPPFGPLFSKLQ